MISAQVTGTEKHNDVLTEPFEAYPGEYHLIKVDAQGNEIPGTDVSIGVRTYDRTYSKLTTYKVKKSPVSSH